MGAMIFLVFVLMDVRAWRQVTHTYRDIRVVFLVQSSENLMIHGALIAIFFLNTWGAGVKKTYLRVCGWIMGCWVPQSSNKG